MEVHHHTHAERKKFKHYIFEFFMLFLAVFCGFLAENFREHYVEERRAKQLAKSLVQDLARDTSSILGCKLHTQTIKNAIDSLREILRSNEIRKVTGNRLYYYGRQLVNRNPFVPSDGTIKQLMSSGSLRYFPSHLVDSITDYDRITKWVTYDQSQDEIGDQYLNELQGRFFDPDLIALIKIKPGGGDWSFENDSELNIQSGLLDYDPVQIRQLKQFSRLKSNELKRLMDRIDILFLRAKNLIVELKKEYSLSATIH